MKIISVWQPFASLLAHRHKMVETRSWVCPQSLIGKRIGIASTKVVYPLQRTMFLDETFQFYYRLTGLPDKIEEMPLGAIICSALLHSCDVMIDETLDDVTEEEKTFGVWEIGRYAWRLRDVQLFDEPIYTRGFQGIWDYPDDKIEAHIGQKGTQALRRHLHVI